MPINPSRYVEIVSGGAPGAGGSGGSLSPPPAGYGYLRGMQEDGAYAFLRGRGEDGKYQYLLGKIA